MSAKIEIMEKHNLAVLDRAFQMAPAELQYLKNKSLAIIYQYLTGMALANVSNNKQLRLAGQKLIQSVYFYPDNSTGKTNLTLSS
jgi:hypothetical protein